MSIQLGLVNFNGVMVAAWKGSANQDQISWAQFPNPQQWVEGGWLAMGTLPGDSSVGPSLACQFASSLYAAWKGPRLFGGEATNDELFFSRMDLPGDAVYGQFLGNPPWVPAVQIPGSTSAFGPALVIGSERSVIAFWAGTSSDLIVRGVFEANPLWCMAAPIMPSGTNTGVATSFTGPVTRVPGASTLVGAAATFSTWDAKIYVAWPVAGGGGAVEFATGSYNGTETLTWTSGGVIPGINSQAGPALACFSGSPLVPYGGIWAAWADAEKGTLCCSPLSDLMAGVPLTPVTGINAPTASSDRPAIAASTDASDLFLLWKGPGGDEQIYCAVLPAATQQWGSIAFPGSTGSDSIRAKFPLAF